MTTITSAQDGYWDVGSTWTGGNVPTINDDAVIAHIVTVRDESAVCLSVTVNAGKQLVFECSGGATKIVFKDDANAKIVNSGTITIQNTTAIKKCTWAGGSSTNKVDWQTLGTFNPASYWHLEYVRLSFDFTINAKILYVDKDIWTQNFLVQGDGTGFLYIAAGVTWIVGRSDEDGQDKLRIENGVEMQAAGTSGSHITIRGYDGTHRMLAMENFRSLWLLYYVDFNYVYNRSLIFDGATSLNYFYKCNFKGNNQEAVWVSAYSMAHFRECDIDSGTGWGVRVIGPKTILENCTIMYNGFDIVLNNGVVDAKSTPAASLLEYDSGQLRYYKKLTLTVKTGDTPIQNAYCSLIQDHAEDYRDKPFNFSHAGYTDAAGQVVLWALWKVDYWKGYTKTTIYYSDENNNGPSGTKEKHLLKVTKINYWPSQDESYYMSQDRSDTVYLTPYDVGAGRVIKFGTFQFPHVQSLPEVKKRGFVEKFIPDRNIAYRKDVGGYGRSWRLSGYIDTDIWNTKAAMEALADGTARSFDRGTGEAPVDCIMLDPEFPEDVDRYGRLDYTVTLMEQSNP